MICPHCGDTGSPDASFRPVGSDMPRQPDEGSRGVCMRCRLWWQMSGGQMVKYTPTIDEQVLVALDAIQRQRRAARAAMCN
jgi:hypothetical protein